MKSRNVPISPLVTECKPLQEITFHDLYGSVGFNKLYPYPKASLNVCRNNAFISPLKMLPHEGHLIASSNINLKQSNLSPKKEENYQICTRDLHQQPLQRSSSIQYVYFGLFDNQLSDSEDTQEGGSGLLEPFDNQLLERNVDRNISHQIGIDSLLFAEEGDSPDNVFSDTDDAYYCQQDLPILDLLDSNNHNIDDGNDLCDLASTIEY
ncbi:Hypothetical protein SRAE_X000082700 [Strongyloides ratti]|uniref:Uncharacterized protein n=1 Tax=Strongyloides ratti TaxID=34506 RepID=A0A090LTF2_STRRB|nr:Hypothetical protein SRAE_X000082700 [Strongyloides ratti]CEF71502.1 Hypothetical protein SRAE_X000082700 [Strongyloides ratti]